MLVISRIFIKKMEVLNGIKQHLISVSFIMMTCSLHTHNVGCMFVLRVDKDENYGRLKEMLGD